MTTDYCTSLRPLDAASRGLNNSRRYRSINKTDLNSSMSSLAELLRGVDDMSRDGNKVSTMLNMLSRYGSAALRGGKVTSRGGYNVLREGYSVLRRLWPILRDDGTCKRALNTLLRDGHVAYRCL